MMNVGGRRDVIGFMPVLVSGPLLALLGRLLSFLYFQAGLYPYVSCDVFLRQKNKTLRCVIAQVNRERTRAHAKPFATNQGRSNREK